VGKSARALIEGNAALLILREAAPASPCIANLATEFLKRRLPVITSVAGGPHARQSSGETGHVIDRPRNSAFYATSLHVLLRDLDVQTLILAGGVTSVSVHYTFVDAHQFDYFCRVVEDSTSGSSAQAQEAALQAMEYMQTGARRNLCAVVAALNDHE
jgi:hypothetical protein